MTNVLLAQRVTPLAMLHNSPSGVQQQVSRHACTDGALKIEALFKLKKGG